MEFGFTNSLLTDGRAMDNVIAVEFKFKTIP